MSPMCLLLAAVMLDASFSSPEPEANALQAGARPAIQSEDARRDAIARLAAKGDATSCNALVTALDEPEEDLRNRAAQALYDKCGAIIRLDSAAPALRRALSRGTSVAGAYLLLGRTSGAETISALAPFIDRTSGVKLQPWLAPVPVSLAASVALLRAARPGARDRVLSAVSNGPLAESVFVLHVLDDIHDQAMLKAAAALLNDQREISGGVPSHASPMRRVADLAVDAFSARLAMTLTFPLTPSRRYNDVQLNEARTAVAAALSAP